MNRKIIQELNELYISASGYRKAAFLKALKIVQNLDFELDSVEKVTQLKQLGIGTGIRARIIEIIETGKLSEEESEDAEKNKIIHLFTQVWSLGDKAANKLYDKGARTIEDLYQSKYFKLLTTNQKKGLQYYQDFKSLIPYSAATPKVKEIYSAFKKFITLKKLKSNESKIMVLGSYARNQKYISDLDFIVSFDSELSELVDFLVQKEIVTDILALGETKFMGVVKIDNINFRIDIIFSDLKSWPFAVLYFRGPQDYVRKLRKVAKSKGYTLNEFGLLGADEDFETPEQIVEFLE